MSVEAFLRCIDTINEWVGKTASFLLIPLTFIAALEVTLRYVFNRPTIWAWDVNIQLMAGLIFLIGGYVLLKGGHVAVDVLVTGLSPRRRAVIDVFTSVLFFFGVGVLLWQGAMEAWHSLSIRENWTSVFAPPIYPLKVLVPIAVSILLLQGLAKLVRDLTTIIEPRKDGSQ